MGHMGCNLQFHKGGVTQAPHISPQSALGLDKELQDLMFSLMGFGLAVAWSLSISLFLYFGMGIFTQTIVRWKLFIFFWIFHRDSQLSLPWVSEDTLNLNFSKMLELLRLWQLSRYTTCILDNKIDTTSLLWAKSGILWFTYKMEVGPD